VQIARSANSASWYYLSSFWCQNNYLFDTL